VTKEKLAALVPFVRKPRSVHGTILQSMLQSKNYATDFESS